MSPQTNTHTKLLPVQGSRENRFRSPRPSVRSMYPPRGMTGRTDGVLGVLFLVVLVSKGQGLLISPQPLSWTEAQAFCRSNQSILIPGTKAGFPYPHWTGLYHRLSDWIHVLGCYEVQDVLDLEVTSNLTLSRASVGLCQENCGLHNFALQNTTCLCLKHRPQGEGVFPSRCHRNCSADDDSHVNDCGGSDTYNVYGVTSSQTLSSEKTVNCMVLGCYEQWSQIHADNCTEDLGRICQSEATTNKSIAPDEDNFKSWSETYTECKHEGSYLFGNFSVGEASGSLCSRLYNIRSNTPETWLGVARQVFLTRVKGDVDIESVIDCSVCHGLDTGCAFVVDCNSNSMEATAVCGNADDLSFPEEVTTTASTRQTPAANSNTGDDSTVAIAVAVPVVVLLVVCAVLGAIIVRKRRKKAQKSNQNYTSNTLIGSARRNGSTMATPSIDKRESLDISGKVDKPHYHVIEFQKETKPAFVASEKSVSVSGSAHTASETKKEDSTQLSGGQIDTTDTEQNNAFPSTKSSGDKEVVSHEPSTDQERVEPLNTGDKPLTYTEQIEPLHTGDKISSGTEQTKSLDTGDKSSSNTEPVRQSKAEKSPLTDTERIKLLDAEDKPSTKTENRKDTPEKHDSSMLKGVDPIDDTDQKCDLKAPNKHIERSEGTSVPPCAVDTKLQVPAIKTDSNPPPSRQTHEGKPVNRKNVSVIQVSRF